MKCEICDKHETVARIPSFDWLTIHKKTIRGLIEALQIIDKYVDHASRDDGHHSEHDVLYVGGSVDKSEISQEDLDRLDKLGFFIDEEFDCWATFN